MFASRLFVVGLAFAAVVAAAKDVPLGECHKCESYCFEDCVAQYHDEVIQGERRDAELKQRMVAKHGAGHASARGLAGVALVQDDQKRALSVFNDCLSSDKCPTHPVPGSVCALNGGNHTNTTQANKTSLIEQAQCVSGDQPCTQGCAAKAMAKIDGMAPALVQKNLRSAGFPHAPVKRGAFAEGKMTLDFCMKSCLAVTCGCSSAPGFEKIEQLFKQITKNENHGDPVADTPATWQFGAATQQECAGGIPGKKVNSGLYVNLAGAHVEICTKEYYGAFYGKGWSQDSLTNALKKCKSRALEDEDYGCSWRDGACKVASETPSMPCFKRFKRDPTL